MALSILIKQSLSCNCLLLFTAAVVCFVDSCSKVRSTTAKVLTSVTSTIRPTASANRTRRTSGSGTNTTLTTSARCAVFNCCFVISPPGRYYVLPLFHVYLIFSDYARSVISTTTRPILTKFSDLAELWM